MAPEATIEMPALKIGRQIHKPGENLFFVTKETTVKRNNETLFFLAKVADQFPFDSVIKKDLASLIAESRKNPAILAGMKTTVGVEQIA
ncbi:MAG: hypothetical protein WC861_03825 [Candidatus Micrarchaeia archaeon]|jgi:hypothetical protein